MRVDTLKREGKPELSYVANFVDDVSPVIIFVHGFKSDKQGTKAVFLGSECLKRGYSYIRFDCAAHGLSGGDFAACCISSWMDDLIDIMALCGQRPVILIGSSMGGWLSLLAARKYPGRVAGFIGIAAAPDFTDEIFYDRLGQKERDIILEQGHIDIPSGYEDSLFTISKLLIEDGRDNFLLHEPQPSISCPVRLLQGKMDRDVPWEKALKIEEVIGSEDCKVIFIEDGDHRLSRDSDLEILTACIDELYRTVLS